MSECEKQLEKIYNALFDEFRKLGTVINKVKKENWKEKEMDKIASARIKISDAMNEIGMLF